MLPHIHMNFFKPFQDGHGNVPGVFAARGQEIFFVFSIDIVFYITEYLKRSLSVKHIKMFNGVPVSLVTCNSVQKMNDALKWHLVCVAGSHCILRLTRANVRACHWTFCNINGNKPDDSYKKLCWYTTCSKM